MLLLDANEPTRLEEYLKSRGWLHGTGRLETVERAGEGNMNLVLRARTSAESVIVKQSRDWVEKYPEIEAPGDRICVETEFYRAVADEPALASRMPQLIAFDEVNRIALLEDLGQAADFTDVYDGGNVDAAVMAALWDWLSRLHGLGIETESMPLLENRAMRELNHAHIFDIPLQHENGLDLDAITPGLGDAAKTLQADDAYRNRVSDYGARYLANGPTLLHGDYYPGSWLKHHDGVKIIDPEFAFFGPAAFDCGVFIAHLHLAGLAPQAVEEAVKLYRPPEDFNAADARIFAGIEIMRRLIGVAQLPLGADLAHKSELLDLSRRLVLGS